MSPFGSTMALSGSTTSPVELSWQSLPTSSYPAGHRGLSADCAAAGPNERLIVEIVSASLRILALQAAERKRFHGHVGRRSKRAQSSKGLPQAFAGVARRSEGSARSSTAQLTLRELGLDWVFSASRCESVCRPLKPEKGGSAHFVVCCRTDRRTHSGLASLRDDGLFPLMADPQDCSSSPAKPCARCALNQLLRGRSCLKRARQQANGNRQYRPRENARGKWCSILRIRMPAAGLLDTTH